MRFAALAFLIPTLSWCATLQPLSIEDWWAWRKVASPRINTDGTDAVYVETWNDRATDRVCANLWTVSIAEGRPRRLTEGAWRDSSPRWGPDATSAATPGAVLAWISDRSGTPQIWVRRMGNSPAASAEKITDLANAPLAFAWSPDGKSLALTARVGDGPAVRVDDGAAVRVGGGAAVRMGRDPAARIQLFIVPAAGGKPRALPLGDLEPRGEPAWMPDGQSILISAAPPLDAAHALEGGEIYAVRVSDGARRQITHHPGPDEEPVPSPDGSRIAWIAREPKPQSYVVSKLYVANPDGTRAKVLAGSLDRDVRHPQWSSDSRTVYFLADDRGATHVYAARNDGSVRQVTRAPDRLNDFSVADTGRAVTVRAPGELLTFPVDLPAKPVTLAAPNRQLLAGREPGVIEEIQYASGGKTIQGWVVKPPGFDAAKKYPLLVDIDDAPRRMCGPEFRWRSQWLAARGFVVLCANPRGTPGYGEEFGNLIRSRFPGDDFDDLMGGVDHLIAKGLIDAARLTVKGGLLAAWAIGHTDRFHAAIAVRPIVDWATEVASAPDGLYRAAAWMGAMPWDDPDQYVKHSPLYFAGNFKTPTLVIAGERDPGAEQLLFALDARRVERRFSRLGDTPRPSEQMAVWEAMAGWANRP